MTLIGQYDLWVRRGLVSVLGAELHPSSSIHRIYAPSTHSLPCIQPILDKSASKHEPAEITVLPCCTRLRMLRQLSPKFGKIWNRKPVVAEEASNVDRSQRSFVFVSAQDFAEKHLRQTKVLIAKF